MTTSSNNTEKMQVYNLIILDRSGSMGSIAHAAVMGLNNTLDGVREAQTKYAENQEHLVSLILFDSTAINYVHRTCPIKEVQDFRDKDFKPGAATPLYDAMGKGLTDMLKEVEGNDNAMVSVTIITDGMENDSKEYTAQSIKELVERLTEKYGWNFSYIGANQDVKREASKLAIGNTMEFSYDDAGMQEAFERERRSKRAMYSEMDMVYASVPREERSSRIRGFYRENRNYREMGEFGHRTTPEHITHLANNEVFVFGSNPLGHHNGGAAAMALNHFGAIMGQAEGLQGQSYAIISTEDLGTLELQVHRFIRFAMEHPERRFLVTRIGCGSGGRTDEQVAPLFAAAINVENISLPRSFWERLI